MLHLDQALEMGLIALEEGGWDDSKLHATDLAVAIGEACPRQLWLRLRGADKKKPTQGQLLMFRHGKRIHKDLTTLLRAGLPGEWEIVGVEVAVQFDNIIGTADCLMVNRSTNERVIVDYKTLRGRAFGYLDNVKPAHALQVQTYCYAINKIMKFDANYGMILYVDREGQNAFQQFRVELDDELVKDAIAKTCLIRDIEAAPPELKPTYKRGKNKGPDSIKLAQPWQCDYCDYLDITCQGALPRYDRELGIVGYFDGKQFSPKDTTSARVTEHARKLLDIPF